MVNDSVREELAPTISKAARIDTPKIESIKMEAAKIESARIEAAKVETIEKPVVSITPATLVSPPAPPQAMAMSMSMQIEPAEIRTEPPAEPVKTFINKPMVNKPETSELYIKPTSPTLVDFHNKNAALPDWRLQLQNSVRKRMDRSNETEAISQPVAVVSAPRSAMAAAAIAGATALKVQIEEKPQFAPSAEKSPLERAMERIEQSRQKFMAEEAPATAIAAPQTAASTKIGAKSYPYVVLNKAPEAQPRTSQTEMAPRVISKPRLATPLAETRGEIRAEKFDTNKLPPLPAAVVSSFEKRPLEPKKLEMIVDDEYLDPILEINEDVVAYSETALVEAVEVTDDAEADDRAPLSLRFNSAIFDLLIGSFLSLLLLSPFMLFNGKFFSTEGFLAFIATCSIVMFIYMTTTIGFLGRTFGMRLFSLEIIDIDENAYPTIHQAAVSSSVYLVSLALGGLGFLTLLINNEKRAAHDLLSGTIIVKEY